MTALTRRALVLGSGALVAGCAAGWGSARTAGRHYAIATNHPLATRAAEQIKQMGGGAYDMMIAAIAASWVVDPANSSPFGRIQGVNASGVEIDTIHAATMLRDAPDSTVPIPGNIAAIELCRSEGRLRLPLAQVLRPAIAIARGGHAPSQALRDILRMTSDTLDHELRDIYLAEDGLPRATLRNMDLADLIQSLGQTTDGDSFWKNLRAAGTLPWSADELQGNRAWLGQPLRHAVGSLGVLNTTANIETWGPWTMLGIAILDRLHNSGLLNNAARAAEAYAVSTILLLERLPFRVGTLEPKVEAPNLDFDLAEEADSIARRTAALVAGTQAQLWQAINTTSFGAKAGQTDDRNTTHFSIADGQDMLAWTTSIGPWFGSRQACCGAALGYSYAMRSGRRYRGQTHDGTELSPIVMTRDRVAVLAIGAAGSERILGALSWMFMQAIRSAGATDFGKLIHLSRLFPKDGALRIHHDMPRDIQNHLISRGFAIQRVDYDVTQHLGIVGLVERDKSGVFSGAADPSSSGLAL